MYLTTWEIAFCQTAQTGINTITPQQVLHISGTPSGSTAVGTTGKFVVTPTMRVDGLNQTNNSVHPAAPAISTQPLYATESGDLVAGNRVQVIQQGLAGTDLLPVQTLLAIPMGVAGAQRTIYTKVFTLKQPSLVYFSAGFSFDFKNVGDGIILDGASKMGGLKFSFLATAAGSGVPTGAGTYFAASQYPFSQKSANGTGAFNGSSSGDRTSVPYGHFIFNLVKVLKLPVGTYTFNIIACGSAGDGAPFSLYYGAGTDNVNITAIAL